MWPVGGVFGSTVRRRKRMRRMREERQKLHKYKEVLLVCGGRIFLNNEIVKITFCVHL